MSLREIVEAGAGCGKTTGLVDRYVAALGLHKDPELKARYAPQSRRLPHAREILALTFTNEAARQMQDRILRRLSDDGFSLEARSVREDAQISTYHSFCLRTLQPHLAARGFDGELLTPTLADYLRREYLLRALSEYPEAARVRRALSLPAIMALGAELWFHPLGSSPAEELARHYEELEKRFESFRSRVLTRCEEASREASARDKKVAPESWLKALLEALTSPSRESFAKVNFTRGPRWYKTEFSDLVEEASDLRDFFKEGYASFLDPESRREEILAQDALWSFLKWALPRAPKIFDFEAAEQELLKLLRESAPGSVLPPPRVILVDEFQDTNSVQYEILKLVSNEDTEWYFVGDPKQSIYAFRGGDVSLFYRLRNELERKNLDTNYRSHTRILEVVNRLQTAIFRSTENPHDPEAQILKWPEGKHEGHVSMHWLSAGESTLEYAAKLLLENRSHFESSSTGVLFRTWDKLYRFAEILRSSGLRFRIAGSENPFDHLLTDVFCSYLLSQENPENLEGFWSLERWTNPAGFSWNSLATPEELVARHSIQERSWSSSFQRFCENIEVRRFAGAEAWVAAMERWLASSVNEGLPSRMTRSQLALWIQKNRSRIETDNPYRISPDEASEAGLTLLTLHGSKGLEFGHVYLPELFERPPQQRDESLENDDGDLMMKLSLKAQAGQRRRSLAYELRKASQSLAVHAEQKRLLYVALTRAIETLHIVGHLSKKDTVKREKDALRVVGASKSRAEYWHEVLQAIDTEGVAQTHISEAALPGEGEEVSEHLWSLPDAAKTSPSAMPEQSFQRCGVSRYLKLQDANSDEETTSSESKHRNASFDFAAQNDVGSDFHALLERWNGDENLLPTLLSRFDERLQSTLSDAALKLRRLPELADYWATLTQAPERIQREFGVFLLSPEYRLSGFADVVWFKSENELCLIDWKSGSSLSKLQRTERIEKFREQLALYARGFAASFPRIKLEVYGIGLGASPEVARVLSEEILTESLPTRS